MMNIISLVPICCMLALKSVADSDFRNSLFADIKEGSFIEQSSEMIYSAERAANEISDPALRPPGFGLRPSASTRKIFLLGVHKCGTSSLTSALRELGLVTAREIESNFMQVVRNEIFFGIKHVSRLHKPIKKSFDFSKLPTVDQKDMFAGSDLFWGNIDGDVGVQEQTRVTNFLLDLFPDALFVITTRKKGFGQSLKKQKKYDFNVLAESYQKFTSISDQELDAIPAQFLKNIEAIVPPSQLLHIPVELDNGLKSQALCSALSVEPQICSTRLNVYPTINKRGTDQKLVDPDADDGLERPDTQNFFGLVDSAVPARTADMAYATVLGVNEDSLVSTRWIDATLVWAQSLRDAGALKDIVVICVSPISPQSAARLRKQGLRVMFLDTRGNYFSSAPPGVVDGFFHKVNRAKIFVLALFEYQKVVYLDIDILALHPGVPCQRDSIGNIDDLFAKEGSFGFNGSSFIGLEGSVQKGSKSPIEGSFFIAKPDPSSFADLIRYINQPSWTPELGWNFYGRFDFGESWISAEWDFWAAFGDQGILFHYFFLVQEDSALVSRDAFFGVFYHFGGGCKPWNLGLLRAEELHQCASNTLPLIAGWLDTWTRIEIKEKTLDNELTCVMKNLQEIPNVCDSISWERTAKPWSCFEPTSSPTFQSIASLAMSKHRRRRSRSLLGYSYDTNAPTSAPSSAPTAAPSSNPTQDGDGEYGF